MTSDGGGNLITIYANQEIIIQSDVPGTRRTISSLCFTINAGATLTLRDIYANGGGVFIENHSSNTLTLDNCYIYNYFGVYTAVIYSTDSPLTIAGNVKFDRCHSYGDYGPGGAISVHKNGLTFTGNVEFDRCTSDTDHHWCQTQWGGAIFVAGDLLIEGNATFTNCHTACWYNTGHGGAVYAMGNVEIRGNACFTDNIAYAGLGGAIYAHGRVILNGENNVFMRNKCSDASDGYVCSGGGAIYCHHGGTISNTVFGGSAEDANEASLGGAILTGGLLTLNDCEVSYNNATGWGNWGGYPDFGYFHAYYNDVNTGGGIAVHSSGGKGLLVLNNTKVKYNEVRRSQSSEWNVEMPGFGGGIGLQNYCDLILNAGSEISHNSAADDGGGVFGPDSYIVMNDDAQISHNEAANNGGGVWGMRGGSSSGGNTQSWGAVSFSTRIYLGYDEEYDEDMYEYADDPNCPDIGIFRENGEQLGTISTKGNNGYNRHIFYDGGLEPGNYYLKFLGTFNPTANYVYGFSFTMSQDGSGGSTIPASTSAYYYSYTYLSYRDPTLSWNYNSIYNYQTYALENGDILCRHGQRGTFLP